MNDSRNLWTAESCLRRALEALFDIGRHILARNFGKGVSEYKEIARLLMHNGVISEQESNILQILAGYRNRLVHFYHEVSSQELFQICKENLGDIGIIKQAYIDWIKKNPDCIDTDL